MLKELSVKEALTLLAEKYPESVKGWFYNINAYEKKMEGTLDIRQHDRGCEFRCCFIGRFDKFAIEVQDEYRYMTQQEFLEWLVIIGYKNHLMKPKASKLWFKPYDLGGDVNVNCYEYRTIQEIDGKIVYGEPQEFKVRV